MSQQELPQRLYWISTLPTLVRTVQREERVRVLPRLRLHVTLIRHSKISFVLCTADARFCFTLWPLLAFGLICFVMGEHAFSAVPIQHLQDGQSTRNYWLSSVNQGLVLPFSFCEECLVCGILFFMFTPCSNKMTYSSSAIHNRDGFLFKLHLLCFHSNSSESHYHTCKIAPGNLVNFTWINKISPDAFWEEER